MLSGSAHGGCCAHFRAIKGGWVWAFSAVWNQPGFVTLMGTEYKCFTQVPSLGSRSLRSDLILPRGRVELRCVSSCPSAASYTHFRGAVGGRNSRSSDFQPGTAASLMPGCAPSHARQEGQKPRKDFKPLWLCRSLLFVSDPKIAASTAPGSPQACGLSSA